MSGEGFNCSKWKEATANKTIKKYFEPLYKENIASL